MKRTMPEPSWIETACTELAEADHLRLLEELVRCTNGAGYTENHDAEGWLVSPEGKRIVRQCESHATEVMNEYAEKLGETWTFERSHPRPGQRR